jgi:hypothetical protein
MEHGRSHRLASLDVPKDLSFDPARLPPIDDPRYEVKFTADVTDLPHVLAWIGSHRLGFRLSYPDRVVNNVYLDTPALDAYYENLAGVSRREKARYRWYGETHAPTKGTLEIKCRRDSIGWKWNAPVNHPMDLDQLTWMAFHDQLRSHVDVPFQFLLDSQPFPALINRYRRTYLESRDRVLRVTVDRDIELYPQVGRARPSFRFRAHSAKALVIEVKCAARHRNLAAEALMQMPWRVSRHSKYALGIESLENL